MLGGCHCGAIRYRIEGPPITHALCHCRDCRHHAGAPMVGWAMFMSDAVTIEKGAAKTYRSSEHGRRQFCADCGTGLFYINDEILPGILDVQSATLDNPNALSPEAHIQYADRLDWVVRAHELPTFDRFPPES